MPVVVNCTESQQCHEGSCIVVNASLACLCHPGYEGELCDLDIDECASGPCQNNATCVNGVDEFKCSCKGGYTGN